MRPTLTRDRVRPRLAAGSSQITDGTTLRARLRVLRADPWVVQSICAAKL